MVEDNVFTSSGNPGSTGNTATALDQETFEETPSMLIVQAVAETTGQDPLEMTPIYEYVDTDALDTLLDSGEGATPVIRVKFEYEGCLVKVTADGDVSVTEI